MAGLYFNVIYNRSDATETEDSKLALKFVEYLVEKLEGLGFSGYYADRDAIPGRSIFDEMFRIFRETEKTIVVITPDFGSNYWAKYSKQAAFKYLIDKAHQHKLIPIAVNIRDNQTLKELNVNEPLHMIGLTEAEWENTRNACSFNRLKMAFDLPTAQMVVEERGDNRLRTEVHQQLVTRPTSQSSLSYTSSSSTGASPRPSKGSDLTAVSKSKETRTWSIITNSFWFCLLVLVCTPIVGSVWSYLGGQST